MKRGGPLRRRGSRARRREANWKRVKAVALERANYACEREVCKARQNLTVHHRLPRGRGGKDELANVAVLCWDCHRAVHDHVCEDWTDWLDPACG